MYSWKIIPPQVLPNKVLTIQTTGPGFTYTTNDWIFFQSFNFYTNSGFISLSAQGEKFGRSAETLYVSWNTKDMEFSNKTPRAWKNNFLFVCWIAVDSNACIPRKFNFDSVVCVCNATYCDTLSNIRAPLAGNYVIYTSSRDGLRFQRSVGSFQSKATSEGEPQSIIIVILCPAARGKKVY